MSPLTIDVGDVESRKPVVLHKIIRTVQTKSLENDITKSLCHSILMRSVCVISNKNRVDSVIEENNE